MIKNRSALTLDEIVEVINNINHIDTLVLFRISVESGARFRSLGLLRPRSIDFKQQLIFMREPMVNESYPRYFTKETLDFLLKYVHSNKIKPNEPCFKRKLSDYNSELKNAGKKAQVSFPLTTHALRRSFISLASSCGVSLDAILDQIGTRDHSIEDCFLAINLAHKRRELLVKPYGDLIRKLEPLYCKRYEELRELGVV